MNIYYEYLKSAILIFCVIDNIIQREARRRRELGV